MTPELYTLTAEDVAICDAYEALMWRIIQTGPKSAGGSVIRHNGKPLPSISVHDEHQAFGLGGDTVSAALKEALAQYSIAHPPEETPDDYRARRVSELRAALAILEQEA